MGTTVNVFSEPLCLHYSSESRCSFAYLFSLACTLFVFVIPLYLCNSPVNSDGSNPANGIWLKQSKYTEQPNVHFQHRYIFVAQAIDSTTGMPKELFFSTMSSINSLKSKTLRMASIKIREADENFDGKMDIFLISMNLPLDDGEIIYSFQVLLFFDFKLQNHVQTEMETLVYIHHDSGLPISSYSSSGELKLHQNNPIEVRDTFSNLYKNQDLLDPHNSNYASEGNVNNIIRKYQSRAIRADYVERFPLSTRSLSRNSTLASNPNQCNLFNFTGTISVPSQEIIYIPTLTEIIRKIWIQYLSLLVILIFLVKKICRIIFANQLIVTTITKDLDRNIERI